MLSHKRLYFREGGGGCEGKVIEHKMFDFIYKFFSDTFFILAKTERDIVINTARCS